MYFKVPFNWSHWVVRRKKCSFSPNVSLMLLFFSIALALTPSSSLGLTLSLACSLARSVSLSLSLSLSSEHGKIKKNWLLLHKSLNYISIPIPTPTNFPVNLWCNEIRALTFLNENDLFTQWNETNLDSDANTLKKQQRRNSSLTNRLMTISQMKTFWTVSMHSKKQLNALIRFLCKFTTHSVESFQLLAQNFGHHN